MNAAHLHLLLNHFPIIGLVFSILFLILGKYRPNEGFARSGLLLILASGLLAVPTYLSGEPAEKIIEKLPGFSEKLVEAHEEAAEIVIWFMGLTTALAGVGLWLSIKNNTRFNLVLKIVITLNLVTLILIGRVSNLGGKISHEEIRGTDTPAAVSNDDEDTD